MTDLAPYVQAWKSAAEAILSLDHDDWQIPTDLPGWTAHDVLAHLVHLERVILEGDSQTVGTNVVPADYTNAGVEALRDVPTAQLRSDLADLIRLRSADLIELPDPNAPATNAPANANWTWETALQNRAIDMWMHEQDLRRAFDIPGGLDSLGAHVTTLTFASALGFVLAKKAGAKPGTVVRWLVTGPVAVDSTIGVGDDGRARPTDQPAEVTLTMDTEAFALLTGGRRGRESVSVQVAGDAALGEQVLAAMTLTT